jgi:hypothetical protein
VQWKKIKAKDWNRMAEIKTRATVSSRVNCWIPTGPRQDSGSLMVWCGPKATKTAANFRVREWEKKKGQKKNAESGHVANKHQNRNKRRMSPHRDA